MDNNLMLRSLSEKGDIDGVKMSLEDGAEVNSTTGHGMSALHFASLQGHGDIATILLQHKADPNPQNQNGQTPLELAAVKGHQNVVKHLLEAGCDINRQTKFSGMTALHLASKNAHKDVVQLLLLHKADESILDQVRKPPVYYAGNELTARLFQHPYDSKLLRETLNDKAAKAVQMTPATLEDKSKGGKTRSEEHSSQTKTTDNDLSSKSGGLNFDKSQENDTASNAAYLNGEDNDRGRHKDKPSHSNQRQDTQEVKNQGATVDKPESLCERQGHAKSRDKSPSKTPSSSNPNYDVNRGKGGYGRIDHDAKKQLKDHKVKYSEEHKKRMKMNVFDRLMGGKK